MCMCFGGMRGAGMERGVEGVNRGGRTQWTAREDHGGEGEWEAGLGRVVRSVFRSG